MGSFVIDGFQGLFLVPHLPQRTVLLFCNQMAKKKITSLFPCPLELMLKECQHSAVPKGFAIDIFIPRLG